MFFFYFPVIMLVYLKVGLVSDCLCHISFVFSRPMESGIFQFSDGFDIDTFGFYFIDEVGWKIITYCRNQCSFSKKAGCDTGIDSSPSHYTFTTFVGCF